MLWKVAMLFRRIIFSAVCLGLLTGLLMSLFQYFGVTPIIIAAEQYEVQEVADGHSHGGQHHDDQSYGNQLVAGAANTVANQEAQPPAEWEPAAGIERNVYTVISNVLAAIGFSALLLAIMTHFQAQGFTLLNPAKGVLWGLAGFAIMFVVPSLGMPPEIPGLEAAAIEHRQSWWLLAVLSAAIALALICYAPVLFKVLGAGLLVLPHLIGAPHPEGSPFNHPDPQIIEALSALHQQFIIASALSSLLFWLVLGAACGWVLNRQILTTDVSND